MSVSVYETEKKIVVCNVPPNSTNARIWDPTVVSVAAAAADQNPNCNERQTRGNS